MAKDTGHGSRKGAVIARTQSKNSKTGDYTKRNETPGQFYVTHYLLGDLEP